MQKQNLPLVSVVFRTKNSADVIAESLAAIRSQTYPNIEVIVVDNYSTDETRTIAESFGATVFLKAGERSVQANYGVEQASGEFVFISDDDMIADPDYIEKAVAKCEDEGYDAIYRSVVTRADSYWGRVRALERQTYIGDDLIEAAQFFRRQVFLDLGGYDVSIGPVFADDYDMQARLDAAGYRTGRIDAVVTHTKEWQSLVEVARRSFYYGQFAWSYLRKHPQRGATQLFPIRKAFLRNWRLLLADPLHLAGLFVFKIVQYTFGLCGLLASQIRSRIKDSQ